VCCSVLQCIAVHCSVLQCVAVCCSVLQCVAVCCSVSQYVAVCCSVLQCVAAVSTREIPVQVHSVSQCRQQPQIEQMTKSEQESESAPTGVISEPFVAIAVCCSVLQCVAVCCSVLQCVAVRAVAGERVPRGLLRLCVHTITVTHTGSTYCCAEQTLSLWLVVSGFMALSTKTACSISLYVHNMVLLAKRA